MVAVVIPALILSAFGTSITGWSAITGAILFGVGAWLAVWTWTLFVTQGRGTLAPWDPPTRLVVRGPYRHVRNPMITGVALILAGEAVFFRSWGIAIELGIFVIANAIWFPLVEEPGLRERFGPEYEEYRQRVPRWLPKVRP
jgi:protein-S-isoprenylcysteine O-methyltransferase Ste14